MNGNTVTLVGNIVEAPELRRTPSGQTMSTFRLAVNRRWQDRATNEWQEETSFFSCTCWRELAENTAESLPRGARVIVTGRLQQRQWETSEGAKRSTVEIQVDECGPSLRWATAAIDRNGRPSEPPAYGNGSPPAHAVAGAPPE